MKKTLIITLIIFVISFILTVCLGVALGASGIRTLTDPEKVQGFLNKLEALDDKFDDIDDKLEDKFDFSSGVENEDGKKLVYEETDEQEYTKDTIVIGADAAEIIVVPSSEGKRIADMKVYSRINTRLEKNDFTLKINYGDYDVYVSKNESTINSAKLYVYIPECVKTVKIKSDAGDVKVKNLSLTEIDISLDAGEVDLNSTVADRCNIDVNAGEVELENGFCAYEANVTVDTGSIKYELPSQGGVEINYSVDIGTLELEELTNYYVIYDKDGKELKTPSKEGKIEFFSMYSSMLIKANLKTSVGNIEIEQD